MKSILVVCAMLLLFLAGCTQQAATQDNAQPSGLPSQPVAPSNAVPSNPSTSTNPANAAVKDCGTNMGCFRQALENNCQDAFALTNSGILHQIQLVEGACAYTTAERPNASSDEFMPALGAGLEVPIIKCTGATENVSVLRFAGTAKSTVIPLELNPTDLADKGYQITWYTNETRNNACIYIQDNGNVLFFSALQSANTSSQ